MEQMRSELLQERAAKQDLECDKISLERQVRTAIHEFLPPIPSTLSWECGRGFPYPRVSMWDTEVRDRMKFMLTHNINRSWRLRFSAEGPGLSHEQIEGSSSMRLLTDKVTH